MEQHATEVAHIAEDERVAILPEHEMIMLAWGERFRRLEVQAASHAKMESEPVCRCLCGGRIAEDKSELVAKKHALESWLSLAGKYGEQYTRWGIAWNRQLDCTRTDTGVFRCKAVGRPCAIRQVPVMGAIRLRRGTTD